MKYSALIIGLGNIGLNYDLNSPSDTQMTHTSACLNHDMISKVYGMDPDSSQRSLFEKTTQSKSFLNFQEIDGKIDICIISTPSDLREDILKHCILLSPKAIIIEKPLSKNLEEAIRLKQLCQKSGIPIYVNYIRLFDKELMGLKKRILEKGFGTLCAGQCVFAGDILNIASHYISLLIDYFGTPIETSSISSKNSDEMFILKFSDFDFVFKAVNSKYALGEMELFFPEHKILFKNSCMDVDIFECISNPTFPANKCLGFKESISADLLNYQYNVLDYVIANIASGKHDSNSLDNAFQTLKVCLDLNL